MGPHLATIHGELTPMAEATFRYMNIMYGAHALSSSQKQNSKIQIQLRFFLGKEGRLSRRTQSIMDEIYNTLGYKTKLPGDDHCNEIIKTAVVEDSGYGLVEYPSQWLRELMLAVALFDAEAKHSKSCDWLCGKANRWWSHELTEEETTEYNAIEKEWKIEVKAHKDGLRLTHPGRFGYYLKILLGNRSLY